jgi:hypothetical protein
MSNICHGSAMADCGGGFLAFHHQYLETLPSLNIFDYY